MYLYINWILFRVKFYTNEVEMILDVCDLLKGVQLNEEVRVSFIFNKMVPYKSQVLFILGCDKPSKTYIVVRIKDRQKKAQVIGVDILVLPKSSIQFKPLIKPLRNHILVIHNIHKVHTLMELISFKDLKATDVFDYGERCQYIYTSPEPASFEIRRVTYILYNIPKGIRTYLDLVAVVRNNFHRVSLKMPDELSLSNKTFMDPTTVFNQRGLIFSLEDRRLLNVSSKELLFIRFK